MTDFFKKFGLITSCDFDAKLIHTLKNQKNVSRQVLGRGTLTMNAKDLSRTEAFKNYASKGRKIVANKKSI